MSTSAPAAGAPIPMRLFAGVCTLAALTMLSYGIAAAAGQALFLNTYGSGGLPYAWLAVAATSMVSVALVNRFSARFNVVQLFVGSAHISAALLVLLMVLHMVGVPHALFATYVWKDIYVVVLVELFWTFSNVAFGIRTASKTYGLYCAAGSVGNILGSLAMKPLTMHMGTFHSLWLVVPTLWAAAFGCKRLARGLTLPEPSAKKGQGLRWHEGFTVLRKSHYLGLLLIVVALVQVVITVTDFQFNEVVEATYGSLEARATVFGDVNAIISGASFVLQVFTGFILHHLGVRGVLLGIPLLVTVSLAAFVTWPGFVAMAIAKVLGKTLDYSLFRAAKEILYIPLTYAEKTQGKALVDMLTYRVAKGAVSLLLIVVGGLGLQSYLGTLNTALALGWGALTVIIVRRYRAQRAYESVTDPS